MFTTVGHGAKSWQLTDEQIASWQALYPSLDVDQQCRMALAWTEANHKKTAKGMPRFLVNWLNGAIARGVVKLSVTPLRPDCRGHYPPCRTNTECVQKVLAS